MSFPSDRITEIISNFPANSPAILEPVTMKSLPELVFEGLIRQAKEIESQTNGQGNGALIATLTSGGSRLQVEAVELDGQLVIVRGYDDEGAQASVVQHYTQISMLFRRAAAWVEKHPVKYQVL